LWHNIDKNGNINSWLKNDAAVYIYKITCNETYYYIGSSVQLTSRLSSQRSCITSWANGDYKNGSPKFYNSVLKYGWNKFKFGVLEYIDLSNITGIK